MTFVWVPLDKDVSLRTERAVAWIEDDQRRAELKRRAQSLQKARRKSRRIR
jgi:hypothetical protein